VLIILDSILPVFSVIALGSLLRRSGLADDRFVRVSDRIIYFIFFPALLFLKLSAPSRGTELDWQLMGAAICAVFTTFVGSLVYVSLAGVSAYRVGSFSQVCFRFNSYVGMALVLATLGEPGARQFALVIGLVVPFINVLSVGTLIWFSGEQGTWGKKLIIFLKELILNPLIIACLAGFAYSSIMVPLPRFVENTLALMSSLALPLSLMSIGASLTFTGLREHFRLALVGNLFKLLVLPITGYLFLRIFAVVDMSFKVAMLYFCLPTSPAIYILSSQLNSDVDLATTAIVLSVLLSIVSLSTSVLLFLN